MALTLDLTLHNSGLVADGFVNSTGSS